MANANQDDLPRETGVDWSRAIIAGVVATVTITITMGLFGMNIMKMLGSMMLGPDAGVLAQYVVGGAMHFMVGIIYGIVYAALFATVRPWGDLFKGAVFGTVLTAIALVFMPVMTAMMAGGGAAPNPCAPNPCAPPSATQPNPCNPCAAQAPNPCAQQQPANPCNPCSPAAGGQNPCAPAATAPNACAVAGAANPCNPCAPGGGNPYGGLVSLLNHLVYGIVLALVYGRGRRRT